MDYIGDTFSVFNAFTKELYVLDLKNGLDPDNFVDGRTLPIEFKCLDGKRGHAIHWPDEGTWFVELEP